MPQARYPTFFWCSRGSEEAIGSSFANIDEANKVVEIVWKMIETGIDAQQIGVITPYNGQKSLIEQQFRKKFTANEFDQLEIASVDGYQVYNLTGLMFYFKFVCVYEI